MKNAIKLCLLLFCLFAPSSARADSFVISTAPVTAGTFTSSIGSTRTGPTTEKGRDRRRSSELKLSLMRALSETSGAACH